jgi:AAA ATPase domain
MVRSGKPKSDLKRSGTRRLGDDYQDIIALDRLIDWLEHSARYRRIRVEADDSGALDDVTAELANGALVVRQVKFSTHPEADEDRLTWETLLKREAGQKGPKSSLLQKWASSLRELTTDGQAVDAALVSNRQASEGLARVLRPDKTVNFDSVPTDVRQEVERQLGNATQALAFFSGFKFELNWPNLSEFRAGVRERFFRLGGTDRGWQSLMEEVRAWVCFRNRPNPGGVVTLSDVKRAAQWYQLQSLPQRYQIPTDYVLPSLKLHEDLINRLLSGSQSVTLLSASPGAGKSTYMSKLFEDLKARNVPVVRHHYFLSLTDELPAFRVDHLRAAESLMHDLLRDHAEALGDLADRNPKPAELRAWLQACGSHFAAHSRRLVLILDGLDHVWRESRSIDELDRLLNFVLPVPPGVSLFVATQPVDNTMLPAKLLRNAPRNTWIELPLLGRAETKEWLTHHIGDFAGFEDGAADPRVERLADSLQRRSRGHPLHLRFTLRAIQEQQLAFDENTIGQLPECPHEGIVAYYRELWHVIPNDARQILHLFAACRFPWPKNEIIRCLDPAQLATAQIFTALQQIAHLLLWTELGLRPFHGSLLAFVSQLPDHPNWAPILKEKALGWLRGPAPEYWNWAYAWRLAADLGDDNPLLAGPDRSWTVDAISKCRPESEVKDILSRAISCAANGHQFTRVIELGLLKDYYVEAYDTSQTVLESMLFARLLITDEPGLRNWLKAHFDELTDEQVRLFAEASARKGEDSRTLDCLNVLHERLRSGGEGRQYWDERSLMQRVAPFLGVAALPGGPETLKIVRFAARQREQGYGTAIVADFAKQLLINRDFARLYALLHSVPPLNGAGEVALTPEERETAFRPLALLAIEEATNCDDVALAEPANPYLQIYAAIRQTPDFRPQDTDFPATVVMSAQEYELHQREHEVTSLFTESFFTFLANHLWHRADSNDRWLVGLDAHSWPCDFLQLLNRVARDVAAGLHADRPPPLVEIYTSLSAFPKPEFRGNLNRVEFHYGVAAARAVMDISLVLPAMLSRTGGSPKITKDDIEAIFASPYCFRDSWISKYVALRRNLLTDDALDWLLTQMEQVLASSFGQFPERANLYAELAALAALHGRDARAVVLLSRTAENMLAHGPHKDLLFHHVLSAINALRCERPASVGDVEDKAAEWARRLAAPIAKITEFTDGDETRHLPSSLANTVAMVAPELLPAYYQWLVEEEEYDDALDALEAFVRTADLIDPVALAIAQTATDNVCVQTLAARARGGEKGATDALAALTVIMGQAVAVERPPKARLSEAADLPERPQLPKVAEYPPKKLKDFFVALKSAGYWPQEEAVMAWAKHWAAQGQGPNAFKVLTEVSKRGHTSSAWDAIYYLAGQYHGRNYAYTYLVRAYQDASGWNRFWVSKERVSKYWDEVRTHYPARWADFLSETLLGNTESRDPNLGHFAFERLILYCLTMGQQHLADQLVDEMVTRSLEFVSPIQFPTPAWAFSEERT